MELLLIFFKDNTPTQIKDELDAVSAKFAEKKCLFHQDNAPFLTSAVAMMQIYELWFELLGYPPYSPNLLTRFAWNEEAITFVNNCFTEKDAKYYFI